MNISYKQIQGNRPYQEDRSLIYALGDSFLFSVFDGHSGSKTAETLVEATKVAAERYKDRLNNPTDFLKTVYSYLNENTKDNHDGSTGSSVLITPDKIVVAILGDSPVQMLSTLHDQSGITFPEHNVRSNYVEADAAIKRGGFISNGYLFDGNQLAYLNRKGLQMSRAFGDTELSNVLLREPEVFSYDRKDIRSILVATDGVIDPGHTTNNFLLTKHSTADDIIDDTKYYFDNATAIVIQL